MIAALCLAGVAQHNLLAAQNLLAQHSLVCCFVIGLIVVALLNLLSSEDV